MFKKNNDEHEIHRVVRRTGRSIKEMITMFDELNDVLNNMDVLDFDKMDAIDQLIYSAAIIEFATRLKPLVAKYSCDSPQKTTFLFKM